LSCVGYTLRMHVHLVMRENDTWNRKLSLKMVKRKGDCQCDGVDRAHIYASPKSDEFEGEFN
jgi:hypothetical protein